MDTVTIVWTIMATVALTLAGFSWRAWAAERRDLAVLMGAVLGVSTAACVHCELGMMHATTPAEYGEWMRWVHIPAFFALTSQMLFVRSYLGTGKLWLLGTTIAARLFILIADLAVHPNFNFREISSLRQISFLGEQVSIVGQGMARPWQWVATASMWLIIAFVADAAVQCWQTDALGSRRKALTVGLGLVVPMVITYPLSQLVVFGLLHIPVFISPGILGMLVVIAYELSRDIASSRRARAELVELRSELAQASRVTALGHLASSLAHELGQPLTAIMSNAQAASRQLRAVTPDLEEVRSILDDIADDDTRASDVVHRMRTLIKRQEIEMQPVTLVDLVEDVLALVRTEADLRGITVESSIEPGLPIVLGDRVHISQVLLNLITNGMDAVQSRPPDDRHVRIQIGTDDAGVGVQVAVRDSGPGIPTENFIKLFTPLFTTKADGLGMGLALSRIIIDAHGGRLWAEQSSGGAGSAFRFTLRRAPKTADLSLS
jgi:signal transduction histidine kinase